MNKEVNFTFVNKYQHLIFVAGRIEVRDQLILTGNETMFGVFNTNDNSFQELSHNLDNSSGMHGIHQMCLFNNQMYILFYASCYVLLHI